MLGIRLSEAEEARLARYARDHGRPKSAVARDWIVERLERESIDQRIADAAALYAGEREQAVREVWNGASDAWLRALDAEDGGYDWGPNGPPGER